MSYVGSFDIDDLLTFVVNTQVFSTGAATDADGVPTYRVYEDETTTPILTGSMALLDSANTAGFYSEQITLSAANGFEKGKCYSIYIAATVSSVAGATHRSFQIGAAVDAQYWNGGLIPAVTVTGVPLVDAKYLLGTQFATPATAGIPDVNAKNINNVATTSVTTINANQGTTQPVNFTGTGGSALAKSDMVDIAGAAVSATTAQLGVNVVNNAGSAITSALGVQEVKVASIAANAITTASINDNAITAAKIADAAIDAATFAAGAINAAAIADAAIDAATFATGAINAAALADDAGTEIGTAVWATTTRLLTAGTNIALAKGTGVTGFNDLSAAQVNAEADTALADYDGPTHTELTAELATADDAILAVLAAGVIVTTNNDKTGYALTAAYDAAKTAATQASVDDLPTNAELATSQAAADDATLAAIAALNNLSAAQVNTEVDSGLADVGLTTTVTGRIDAAVTSRMASFTQPTGFLAATFPSDPADQSLVIAATDALASLIGDVPTNAELTTALGTADDAVLAQVALVKADTAAIKLQTDKFVFTVANQADVNVQYVNDVAVAGDGDATAWGPA